MLRIIAKLRAGQTRSGLRAARDQYHRDLVAERIAAIQLRAELAEERDKNETGSLAETVAVWHQGCIDAEAEIKHAKTRLREILGLVAPYPLDLAEHVDEVERRLALANDQLVECRRRVDARTAAARPLPKPIQDVLDWYLREPMAAVLPMPPRDYVRTALAQWQRQE